ncbi:hypothetical protein LSAT2_018190 [Lamellibrachia satsuma]|nr:hypothetical protein LSAT2_018190 [Lamellibrachia satsuma]
MVPRQSAVVTLLVVFSCQLCCGEVQETDAAATQSRHAAGLRRNPVKRHAVEKLPNRQKRLSPSIVFVSQTEWRTTGSRCVGSCYGHTDGSYQSCVACNGYATCTDGKINYNVPCEVPLMWDDLTNSCQTTTTTCRVVIGYSPCKSSPCKNGAVCNSTGDGEKDYVCTCKEGYGRHVSFPIIAPEALFCGNIVARERYGSSVSTALIGREQSRDL